jgi:hypothetical protein
MMRRNFFLTDACSVTPSLKFTQLPFGTNNGREFITGSHLWCDIQEFHENQLVGSEL